MILSFDSMKNLVLVLTLFALPVTLFAQGNIMLMPFEALMNSEWKAEGKWKDGRPFKQEVSYSWSDDEESVNMVTKSYLDTTFTDFGKFSDGVHTWDTLTNTIKFQTKDIHGNVIDGNVRTKVKTIMYEYVYLGENDVKTYMTDALIWIKPDKYMFKVGTMKDDEWQEVYLETYFFKKKD
ncbi:MAG TPA: hypothetical protein DCR04_08895 [Flavobacteriales bacterium]|nr:hypothetical protein [Flavobacteriales bacterium]